MKVQFAANKRYMSYMYTDSGVQYSLVDNENFPKSLWIYNNSVYYTHVLTFHVPFLNIRNINNAQGNC